MAKSAKKTTGNEQQETFARIFWRGFFIIPRYILKGIAWLAHKPPLRWIGHAFRWFFRLRPVRFIGRILGFGFVRSSFQELKLVTWPTWRESRRLTTAVIIFSVVFGALIALVDFGLDKLFKQVLLK